ncbi:MAG: alpha/beta hydrolase [Burkholderiaceae bacterium]|nr:alpha/beta hydrolase [Burkholderiaceae bacterium]
MRAPVTPVPSQRREFPGFDGGSWFADVAGPATAPTVLLLHGGGQTRHAWGGTAQAMARAGWRSVALDLPGHGESAWPVDGDYRIETMSRSMARFWHELGAPLAVAGASLGGLISMAAVARSDAPPISALALVDIAPRVESKGVDRIVDFMRAHPEGFATLEDAARHIAAYRGRPVVAHPRGLQKNLRLNKAGRWAWHWDQRLMNDENHSHRNDPTFFERALAQFRGPLLLVRGGRSDVISETGAAVFRQTFPKASFVNLPGAGHMVAGDANDAFTASLIEFLGEVMPASTQVPSSNTGAHAS